MHSTIHSYFRNQIGWNFNSILFWLTLTSFTWIQTNKRNQPITVYWFTVCLGTSFGHWQLLINSLSDSVANVYICSWLVISFLSQDARCALMNETIFSPTYMYKLFRTYLTNLEVIDSLLGYWHMALLV